MAIRWIIRHGLVLLWFKDLMNATYEVTIHRSNLSTLLSSAWGGGEERGRSQYVRVPNKGARRLLVIVLDFPHPIVWLVRHVCSDKTEFSFLQNKIAFSNVYSLLQSLQGIE